MYRSLIAAAAILAASTVAASAATFTNQTVTLFHYFENTTYTGPSEDQVFVTGKGEFQAGARIVLNDDPQYDWDAPYYFIDLVGDSITIDLMDTGFGWYGNSAATFAQGRGRNGLVLQDTYDMLPDFRALTLTSNGFSGTPYVTVSANELVFDFSHAGDTPGAAATWGVQVVPVPPALPLMAAGLGLMVLVGRKRRSA